ncbi:MAG TPA: hypothetical protein VGR53_10905 [Nitrososphaerales archaeon]|nr:hypothetical protein [Nitrososphaerales archaeon]
MLQSTPLTQKAIDIRPLKGFVAAKFAPHSLLRKVIVLEPDLVPAADIVGKLGTWLAILREDAES